MLHFCWVFLQIVVALVSSLWVFCACGLGVAWVCFGTLSGFGFGFRVLRLRFCYLGFSGVLVFCGCLELSPFWFGCWVIDWYFRFGFSVDNVGFGVCLG